MRATVPSNERERLAALHALHVLDTLPEAEFDRITALAATAFDVPIALISLIDRERQWFKACHGLTLRQTDREVSFCAYALHATDVLIVPDATLDERFAENALVTGEPRIRFYAGAPLVLAGGLVLGTLCIIDTRPRPALTDQQQTLLRQLAEMVVARLHERLEAQRRLVIERRYSQVLPTLRDVVFQTDTRGRWTFLSPAWEEITGYAVSQSLNRAFLEFVEPDGHARARKDFERLLSGREEQIRGVARSRNRDGGHRWIEVTAQPLRDEDGQVIGTSGLLRDVTVSREAEDLLRDTSTHVENRVRERTLELRRANERLRHGVLHDHLTAIENRRAFDEALQRLEHTDEQDARPFHLLLLDLDNLKQVNDRLGHDRGDALLQTFAQALRQSFRASDRTFRLGGDEFAVILEGLEVPPQVLASRLENALSLTRAAGFEGVEVSAGSACYPTDTHAVNELVRLADQRMLRQKASRKVGRRLRATTPAVQSAAARELLWQALRSTLVSLADEGEIGPEGWSTLLAAAVAAVPDAQAGTIYILDGNEFVATAQVGFSDALVGLRQPEWVNTIWYGNPEDQLLGKIRVLRGAQIAQHSARVNETGGLAENAATYQEHGELQQLHASLCAPVVVGGRVVAQLNLENLENEEAFDAEAEGIATEFAAQVAALLAARQRREREAARRRELECLVMVSTALHHVQSPEEAELVLVRQAAQLLGSEHVAFLRFDEASGALHTTAGTGFYARHPGTPLSRGQGLSWAAVTERRVLWVEHSGQDTRVSLDPGEPTGALMVAPLLDAQGSPLAVLAVSHQAHRKIDDLDVQLLEAIASAGATAIQRVHAETARTQRAAELRMLADLSTYAGVFSQPQAVAQRCLAACRDFLGAEHAAFFSFDGSLLILEGRTPPEFVDASRTFPSDMPLIEAMTASDRPILATREYAREPLARPELIATGVTGWVMAPVMQRGQMTGAVSLAWFRPLQALPPAAIPLATRTAELIGQAYERHAHLADVEATREGALQALGLALELRDFETGGHTERVVRLSTALGAALGLPDEDLEALRQGAYLHDIGKLGIPDQILLKPGKLDATEWATMQRHTSIGHDLAQHVPTLHPLARLVIRDHHERWDDRGYPAGLAGERIPLVARIFSVVDVYDALTSERPYKRAWTRDEALAEIRAQAGAQFDPDVVDAFCRVPVEPT